MSKVKSGREDAARPAAKGKEGELFFPDLLAWIENEHDKNISFPRLSGRRE